MRYPASEKIEIIRLVEQSALSARKTLERLGVPRQDGRAEREVADRLHLSEDHRVGLALSLHDPG